MTSIRIINGTIEPIVACVLGTVDGLLITGVVDLEILIQRNSDKFFLDWNDDTFKDVGSIGNIDAPLSESNSLLAPGMYVLNSGSHPLGWDTSLISNPVEDETYHIIFSESVGTDVVLPGPVEIKVDQWPFDILNVVTGNLDIPVSSVSGTVWEAANDLFNTTGTMGALQNLIASRAATGDEMALTVGARGLVVSGVWEVPVNLFTSLSGSTGDTLFSASFRHDVTASVDIPLIITGVWNAANGTFDATGTMGNLQNLVASRAVPGDEMTLTVGARGLVVSGVWQVPINQFTGSVGGSGSAGDTLYSASFIHELTASVDIPGIVTGVWSAANGIFNVTGTMGHLQNKMAVVSQSLETIRKIETNNWKISGTQQVFFEDDTSTPLRIYNLLKSDGSLFVHDAEAVVERVLTGSLL